MERKYISYRHNRTETNLSHFQSNSIPCLKSTILIDDNKLVQLSMNTIYQIKIKSFLYSMYNAKACNEFAGAHLRTIVPGQHGQSCKRAD